MEDEKKQVHFTAGQLIEQYEIASPVKQDRISGFAQKVEEQKIQRPPSPFDNIFKQ